MFSLRQIFTVTELNLMGLPQRFWSSLVIVVGMACVVGVLLSMLSFSTGLAGTFAAAADSGRAIVVRTGALDERGAVIPREAAVFVFNAPGVQRDEDGEPLASTENINFIPILRRDNQIEIQMITRGVGPKAFAVRPEFRLVEGRMFEPGTRELIAGTAAQAQFLGLEVGSIVSMQDGPWEIVGAFETDGDLIEGQLLGDNETIISSRGQNGFGSIWVKLESPESFDVFAEAIGANPEFALEPLRQAEFYQRSGDRFAPFFTTLAYFLGTIIAIGALFGTINIMHSTVAARTREIATLRALGFGAAPVAISVLIEAVLLAVLGALMGAAAAYILFDGNRNSLGGLAVFDLSVTPGLVLLGVTWALIIALLGGLFPAIRAARLPVVMAMRAG
nr:MAG: ABC transporter permease [Hyphomicrobiales bacterium]